MTDTPESSSNPCACGGNIAPPSRDVEKCAGARIAGDETSRDLQDVLGPNSAFSEQWARHTLERDAVVPPDSSATVQTPALRLRAVRRTVKDALRYPEVRNGQLRWRRFQRVAGIFGALMVVCGFSCCICRISRSRISTNSFGSSGFKLKRRSCSPTRLAGRQ